MAPPSSRFESRNGLLFILLCVITLIHTWGTVIAEMAPPATRNAYATMMYMGTPRDYEFYVAVRVMFRSLRRLNVDADLVVIASRDVPSSWIKILNEDGAKVVTVDNLNNPYRDQPNFDKRFALTLNKLYAWDLVQYERVVMLDADNLFLQKTDELFQCGQFCAAFINPCIFHTGLFVLQPSKQVFNDMLNQIANGKKNEDGLDQGFLTGYFDDLLDKPMFHPAVNGTAQNGLYRLPLGYQMDASYYYLKLKWNVPCGPNSVITFPGASWLKPWYWWSWPVLPLGLSWHQQRLNTIGYDDEIPIFIAEVIIYLVIMIMMKVRGFTLSMKSYFYRGAEREYWRHPVVMKALVTSYLLAGYLVPCLLIPKTIHPLLGWGLYLLGSLSLVYSTIRAYPISVLAALTPWMCICGTLAVMANPHYPNGVVRALSVCAYAAVGAPLAWTGIVRVVRSLDSSIDRESQSPLLDQITKAC